MAFWFMAMKKNQDKRAWKKAFDEFFMNSITTKPVGNKIRLNNDNYLGDQLLYYSIIKEISNQI